MKLKGNRNMAKRCTRCGTFLADNERFCPNCGENAVNNEPQQTYQQPTYQQSIQPPPVSYAAPEEPPMTTKKWVGTILLTTCLGFVSLILLFIWAFSAGPKERQNYCKAMLIVKAIMIGVAVLLVLFFSAAVFGVLGELFSEAFYSYDSFYTAASLGTIFG